MSKSSKRAGECSEASTRLALWIGDESMSKLDGGEDEARTSGGVRDRVRYSRAWLLIYEGARILERPT